MSGGTIGRFTAGSGPIRSFRNRTKKRDTWGQDRRQDRPATKWLTLEAEELRIVPESLWQAAHDQIAARAMAYKRWITAGKPAGGLTDGRGVRKQYFLTGFGRCTVCGGSMQAVSRASSAGRIYRYVCASYWNRGATVCPNGRMVAVPAADTAVATPCGGAVPTILDALARREEDRRRLRMELTACVAPRTRGVVQPEALRDRLRNFLGDWEGLLRENVAEGPAVAPCRAGGAHSGRHILKRAVSAGS